MDNIQNRINELIAELSECREDERNTQNQILQVISVAGTILGILFGASYLDSETEKSFVVFQNVKIESADPISKICNKINQNVTYSRVMFWLSLLIFFTAFAYLVVLGINNILRYYYIQNLEDRLHELIPTSNDDFNRGDFLHWNAYIAPIITQNIKHITSTHTALNFGCYVAATCFAILFSMGMVISLFLEIESRQWFDYAVIIVTVLLMLLTFLLFLRTSSKAKEVAQFAWDTAHENQKNRLRGCSQNIYRRSESFKYILRYLIYPKRQDLQKPILIVLGFLYGIILMDVTINLMYLWKLLFVLLIFDFLAYQARYQINDIRGLKEDKEAECRNRLLSNDAMNPGHMIKISFTIAFIKIIVCVLLTIIFGGNIRDFILINLVILLISTIFYEMARAKKITWLIFILVGVGYPLRFFVGFFAVAFSEQMLYNVQTACFMLALLAYGSFSSILAWVNEVIKRMNKAKKNNNSFPISYEKRHFEYIQNIIKNRYLLGENYLVNGNVLPLREKCKLSDPWNLAMLLCIFCLFFIAFLGRIPKLMLGMECAVLISFIINIYLKHKKKMILMITGGMCIIGKIMIGVVIYKILVWYLLFSVAQMIILITYFVLSYQPQVKKINYIKLFCRIKRKIIIKIMGEYAFEIMNSEKNRN